MGSTGRGTVTVHVLHLISSLGAGGAERSLAELVAPLRERGIELSVATLAPADEGVRHEGLTGTTVHAVAGTSPWQRARALRRLVDRLDPDLVHTSVFDADLAGRLARPWLRRPLLCSLINTSYDRDRLDHDPNLRRAKVRAVQCVEAVSGLLVDHFHAITQSVADSAHRHLGVSASRVTVVPRGRSAARLGERTPERRAAARALLGVGDHQTVLLAVGRVEAQKGHRFAVEALPRVLAQHPEAVLLIAGRPGGASEVVERAIAALGLSAQVRMLGHRDDVPDLVAAADVFVFPSVYEGLGGAVVEAMLIGTPVVAADVPALREVLTPAGGLLVPPADSAALGAALLECLEAPHEATARAARARARALDAYSLDAAADGMAALYRAAVQRGPGRARSLPWAGRPRSPRAA